MLSDAHDWLSDERYWLGIDGYRQWINRWKSAADLSLAQSVTWWSMAQHWINDCLLSLALCWESPTVCSGLLAVCWESLNVCWGWLASAGCHCLLGITDSLLEITVYWETLTVCWESQSTGNHWLFAGNHSLLGITVYWGSMTVCWESLSTGNHWLFAGNQCLLGTIDCLLGITVYWGSLTSAGDDYLLGSMASTGDHCSSAGGSLRVRLWISDCAI